MVMSVFGDMETLRATLRDLHVRRQDLSNPAMHSSTGMLEVDVHEMFLNSSAFQETLLTIQGCQQQQKALLADTARVSTLCPSEYPEMLRLSVELMTSFSRLAAPPGSEGTSIENIADGQDDMRQRSFSASI